jgi:hypothetical protein
MEKLAFIDTEEEMRGSRINELEKERNKEEMRKEEELME